MKSLQSNQRGLTFISIVLILGLIAFFTLLILKIGPIYLNHSKVLSSLESLKEVKDIETKSKSEVLSLLHKRFDFNYVEYVTTRDIKITKRRNYVKVEVEYERVEPIVGNLSALAQFYEIVEMGNK